MDAEAEGKKITLVTVSTTCRCVWTQTPDSIEELFNSGWPWHN